MHWNLKRSVKRMIDCGWSMGDILAAYPQLTHADVRRVIEPSYRSYKERAGEILERRRRRYKINALRREIVKLQQKGYREDHIRKVYGC